MVRNKARLVAHGYNQQEGIDFDETFAHIFILNVVYDSIFTKGFGRENT